MLASGGEERPEELRSDRALTAKGNHNDSFFCVEFFSSPVAGPMGVWKRRGRMSLCSH